MKKGNFFLPVLLVLMIVGAYLVLNPPIYTGRLLLFRKFIRDPQSYLEWQMKAGERCGNAPFIFPSQGFVGFLWGDRFRPGHLHQGIDIFGGTKAGQTAVLAVYDGYLTRLPDWKSTLIIRIPRDPLMPDRQIWAYYTHMADRDGNSFISADFPPGVTEVPVKAGTLLGYQGDYSGDPEKPTGVHLHFSIVSDDGNGHFKNELDTKNTLDPSDYFRIQLNAQNNSGKIPLCATTNGVVK